MTLIIPIFLSMTNDGTNFIECPLMRIMTYVIY